MIAAIAPTRPVDIAGDFSIQSSYLVDCDLRIRGNMTVRGPCQIHRAQLLVEGDVEVMTPLEPEMKLKCQRLLVHDSFAARKSEIEVERTARFAAGATVGTLRGGNIIGFGSMRVHTIEASSVVIDGDLMCGRITADHITVERGQLLAQEIICPSVSAPIIANYGTERLPAGYQFTWSRVVPPRVWTTGGDLELTKLSAHAMLTNLLGEAPGAEIIEELIRYHDCSDFQPYFTRLFTWMREHSDTMTPAGQEMLERFEQHGFPGELWRL